MRIRASEARSSQLCHGGPLYTVSSLTTCRNLQKQLHLTNHGHSVDHMEDVMYIKFATLERRYLDSVEKYNVYIKTESCVQINYKSTITKNEIFDVILKFDSN